MDDSFDMTLLHTDLSELEVLRDYTFDSKMLMSQHISIQELGWFCGGYGTSL